MWVPSAVLCLLSSVRHSPALYLLVASTTVPNHAAWDATVADMAARGIPRTAVQIQEQWKAENAAFHKERAYREEYGCLSETPPETYHRIQHLWHCAGCPPYWDRHYAGRRCGDHAAHAQVRFHPSPFSALTLRHPCPSLFLALVLQGLLRPLGHS